MPRNKPDILIEILSCRPVAYYPALAKRVGGVPAAVMLSQLIYWSGTTTVIDRDGWFYKAVDEMESETGLTKYQQQIARRDLLSREVIEAKLKGMPRVWWYRVDMDRLVKYLNNTNPIGSINHPMDNPPNGKPIQRKSHPMLDGKATQYSADNAPNIGSITPPNWEDSPSNLIGIIDYAENTQEITQETTTTSTALPENYKWVVVADQGEDQSENFNELDDALDSIGYFESERPTIVQMVSKYKWTDEQAANLIFTLSEQLGMERAGAVLRYRLAHDKPEYYQRKQSYDSYICPKCNTYPCSCEEN